METERILAAMEEGPPAKILTEESAGAETKLVVFSAGGRQYAFAAEDVQEIMLDLQIHFLPFLPSFVRGLVNRLGEPLTVVDLVNLLGGPTLDGKAFIILKPQVSKMAFIIDAVQDIARLPVGELKPLSASGGTRDNLVKAVFQRRGQDVALLNLAEIIAAVRRGVDAKG